MSGVTVTDGGQDRNVHERFHRGRNSAYQSMSALIKSNVVVNVLMAFDTSIRLLVKILPGRTTVAA